MKFKKLSKLFSLFAIIGAMVTMLFSAKAVPFTLPNPFDSKPAKAVQQCIDTFVKISKLGRAPEAKQVISQRLDLVSLITSTGKYLQSFKSKTTALTETDRQTSIDKVTTLYQKVHDAFDYVTWMLMQPIV